MPLARPSARRGAAAAPVLVATTLALALGPAVAPAAAKTRHAPCPTGGTTILRGSKYESLPYRVYHSGPALRICTREVGRRRHVRALGTWTPATKVVVRSAVVAWTTRRTAADGTAADTIRAADLSDGKRRLTVTSTAVATSATSPATTDTVVKLLTDDLVTVWVTSRGRLAAAVRIPSLVPEPYQGPQAFHAGSIYALGDAGPSQAAALGDGLTFVDDSQTDDCGGTESRFLSIPKLPGFPIQQFNYYRDEVVPGPDCT
jgi:hypothetical protein